MTAKTAIAFAAMLSSVLPLGVPDAGAQTALEGKVQEAAFMVGTWEGSGWMRMPGQGLDRFEGIERVQPKAGGTVLLVEGDHRITSSERGHTEGHQALAVLYWDDAEQGFKFSTWTADGRGGVVDAEVRPGRMVWSFMAGEGTIRYTLEFEGDTWVEIGEYSADGETWSQFFQMELVRRP